MQSRSARTSTSPGRKLERGRAERSIRPGSDRWVEQQLSVALPAIDYRFVPVPLQATQLTLFPKSLCPPVPLQRGQVARDHGDFDVDIFSRFYFCPVPLHAEQLTQFPKSLCPPLPPHRGHVARIHKALSFAMVFLSDSKNADMHT